MVNLEELPDILIVNEVSQYLRVSNYIVEELVKCNMLVGFTFLGKIRIQKSALIDFIKKQENYNSFTFTDVMKKSFTTVNIGGNYEK